MEQTASADLPQALMTEVEVGKNSGDAASYSLGAAVELVQAGMAEESRVGNLRALTIWSRALTTKLEELEISCHQADEAFLYSLYHSLQVGCPFCFVLFFFYYGV